MLFKIFLHPLESDIQDLAVSWMEVFVTNVDGFQSLSSNCHAGISGFIACRRLELSLL